MEASFGGIRKKAVIGVVSLSVKRVLVQVIFTISNIFLARLLFPADFGTFAIVGFASAIFAVFSDLGLGASLVQKKTKITSVDLKTAFTFQIILILVVILAIFVLSPVISHFYNLGDKGIVLFRVYSLYLLFLPFKTTSGALLERSLQYRKLVVIEISQILTTAIFTVVFAILQYGVFSFILGWTIGHLISSILYFKFSPWPLGLAISKNNLISLSKFGLPLQSQTVLGLFIGPLIILYLGKVVGQENLGFYQFAGSLAVFPLAFSEIVTRVIFPLGARMQNDKVIFKQIIERSTAIVSMTTLPLIAVGLAVAPAIIHFIYTDRWLPSLPALYLNLLQMGIIAYTGVFGQLLLALGFAKAMRNIWIFWAILTWVVAPPLIYLFNFVGMSIAGLLISISGIWLCFKLKNSVEFNFWSNVTPFLTAAAVSGLIVFTLVNLISVTLYNLFFILVLGLLFYAISLFIFSRESIISLYGILKSTVK